MHHLIDPQVESHSAGYRWRDRFSDAQLLSRGEGSSAYVAKTADSYWVIVDSGALADFLPEGEDVGLIRVERFQDEAGWRDRCRLIVSRPFLARVERALGRYLEDAPPLFAEKAAAQELGWINERDHLQPWSRDLLPRLIARRHRMRLRTSVRLDLADDWPRVGDVDIAIEEPLPPAAYLELKCGSDLDSLGPCAWDLLKLALCIRRGVCAAGYLVVAAPTQRFEQQAPGTELLEDGLWVARDLRERYATFFREYERRNDPPIRRVPARGSISAIGSTSFAVASTGWSLRVSRILCDQEAEWLEWQPLLGDGPEVEPGRE